MEDTEATTPEDELSDFMGELMACEMTVADLAAALGVSVSTIYRVFRTGRASAKTKQAMWEYWRDGAE